MTKAKSRSTFRVFIKKTEKYLSKSRSKSTWLSKHWALNAARDSNWPLHELEIHEFPVSEAIVYNAAELYEEEREERERKAEEKRKAEEDYRKRSEIYRAKEAIRKAEETLRKHNEL